ARAHGCSGTSAARGNPPRPGRTSQYPFLSGVEPGLTWPSGHRGAGSVCEAAGDRSWDRTGNPIAQISVSAPTSFTQFNVPIFSSLAAGPHPRRELTPFDFAQGVLSGSRSTLMLALGFAWPRARMAAGAAVAGNDHQPAEEGRRQARTNCRAMNEGWRRNQSAHRSVEPPL